MSKFSSSRAPQKAADCCWCYGDATVGKTVVGVDGDGLIKVVDARINPLFGIVGIVFALQIKSIGFRIVGRAFGQLLLIFRRKLRAQTLRNFPGDITLNRLGRPL